MDGEAEDVIGSEISSDGAPVAPKALQFIRDEPADLDFFLTHTALARAIAQTIITNPLLRTIGLLGRWGSGKSTVLLQLEKELKRAAPNKFHIFTYDAWLHQHDPVRRSFIEELSAFASLCGCEQPAELDEDIKKLLGQVRTSNEEITPTLTADAKAILVSLLPVPIGLALLRFDVIKGAFGSETSHAAILTFWMAMAAISAPVITWLARYSWRRPWKTVGGYLWPIRKPSWPAHKMDVAEFFRITDPDGRPSAVIPALINQSIKRTSTRTVALPEPTTIEFRRVFRSIVEALNATGKRLTIVIDNLDRVPEEEALQIWATIRSFFSISSIPGAGVGTDPLVLLPIDKTAVQRMFARSHGEKNAPELSESFVDKTFEVTFEVTQPVMSDWRDYLARQMAFAFGASLGENWTFWTRKFFERKQQEKKLSPTPRQINRLINRLLGSYMQWGSSTLSFPIQAYFVIFQDEIERDFGEFIVSDQPELTKIALRWQEQVAALHFGVDVSKAIQTLLEVPVRQAIQVGSVDGVKEYRDVPGFDDSVELISTDLSFAETEGGANFSVVRNIVAMMDSLQRSPSQATDQTWYNILSYYCRLETVDLLGPNAAKTIETMAAHVPPELKERFVEVSAEAVARGLRLEENKGQAQVRQAATAILDFCTSIDRELPYFYIGDVGKHVIRRFAQASETSDLLLHYFSEISADDLDEAFGEAVREPADAQVAATAFAAIIVDRGEELFPEIGDIRKASWARLLANCSDGIRQSVGSPRASAAIDILFAMMPYSDAAKDVVRAAAQEGILTGRLGEAIDSGEAELIAKFSAALIWAEVDFGTSTPWNELLKRHSELPRLVTSFLRAIHGEVTLDVIWKAYDGAKTARDLVRALIEYGVVQNDLGRLYPQQVMSNLSYYLRPIPYSLMDRFIRLISTYTTFWERLPEVELTGNFQKAAKALGNDKGNRAKIEAIVMPKLEALNRDQWVELVQAGGEPYPVIEQVFRGKPLDFGKGSALFTALEACIPRLFASDRTVRTRWAALRLHLKDAGRKSLINTVAHAILSGQPPTEILAVFKLLGDELIRSLVWTKHADSTVSEVLFKLAGSNAGRRWLKENGPRAKAWIGRATPETKERLAQLLRKMMAAGTGEKAYWAEVCLRDWKL